MELHRRRKGERVCKIEQIRTNSNICLSQTLETMNIYLHLRCVIIKDVYNEPIYTVSLKV